MQDHRFLVTQVPAAAEALEVFGTQYPDAVVLDSDLTNGAGGMVLDRHRQLVQRGRPSPVWIVISALDRRDVVRQYGPSIPHFLAKPFDPWDLIRLKEILVG